ncbi:MAG: sulfatase-like hydrolase/transferase, partial [Flavobacteriales bacterium]|nr:sulfatase-like hydrolase/transferase [Flavobacteriales bacterium]
GQKRILFEGGIRVPFIVSFPGQIPAGEVRNQMVGVEDFFPTILEATGTPMPTDRIIEGESLWPIMKDNISNEGRVMYRQFQDLWAVIKDGKKLYNDVLYDITGDEPELNPISNASMETELRGLYDQWSYDFTVEDIGKPIQGIGCMDTNYVEFDSKATVRDQIFCKTLIPTATQKGIMNSQQSLPTITLTKTGLILSEAVGVKIQVSLTNIQGKSVLLQGNVNGEYYFPTNLSKGVYFISINKRVVRKISRI